MDASERRVAVVGDDDRAKKLREVVRDAGARAADAPSRAGAPSDSDAPAGADGVEFVVPVGREALRETVVDAPSATVVPVGSGRFALGVSRARRFLRRALGDRDGDADDGAGGMPPVRRAAHPVLAVGGREPPRRAAFDVALVTEEPARISEFAVSLGGGTSATFRADGVVVATPLGSDAYANAAGAPIVEPGGGLPVTPIAPFSTQTDTWIAADRLSVTVERGTEPVGLVVDGTRRERVEPNRPIAIEAVDRVEIATVPRGAGRADRKHSNNS